MSIDAGKPENRTEPHFVTWLFTNRGTLCLGAVIGLLTAFYVEEDVRGKWAWQRCQRQLQATGEVFDWNAFVPPPVPEAENVFGAPKMKDWLVFGGSNDMCLRTNKVPLVKYLSERGSGKIAEFKVIPIGTNSMQDADIVLRYDAPVLSLVRHGGGDSQVTKAQAEVIPLIVMDDVPLADAIRNLAKYAGIDYAFAPEVVEGFVPVGKAQPSVTIRWEKVTARQALKNLLANYGMNLVENSKTGVALIKAENSSQPSVYVEVEAAEELEKLVRKAISTNEVPYANGSQGMKLLARTPELKPFHAVLEVSQIPSPTEVKQFFPAEAFRDLPFDGKHLEVDYSGTSGFGILPGHDAVSADDYLRWSERFTPDFERIRDALKRPSVRIGGDYSQPFSQPRVDYVTIRTMAQTLGQRAQSYLLRGEPEKALDELSLLHDMNRLIEGKPVTLVAAMIEVAITGVYISVIEDGFRLDAWRESQLAALEEQLKGINLLRPVHNAFLAERAGACRLLDTQSAAKIQQSMTFPPRTQTIWQRLQNPKELLLSVAPRGWNQQNMVVVAKLAGKYLDGIDANQEIVWPQKLDASAREMQSSLGRVNPQNFLAAMCLPNFKRACQTLAHTQTLVNEAMVACALERYRIARGELPENLERLVPQFLPKVPPDVIGGRRLQYRRESLSRFVLYSVGWNEQDDKGRAVRKENGYVALEEGDWPWDPQAAER
jgi:hypothetical protein